MTKPNPRRATENSGSAIRDCPCFSAPSLSDIVSVPHLHAWALIIGSPLLGRRQAGLPVGDGPNDSTATSADFICRAPTMSSC